MEKLLTIVETAEALRAPVETLRYWRSIGTGPASFKVGIRVVYRERDVEAWIASQMAAEHGDRPDPVLRR